MLRTRGFTLFELMVVLAIIAAMVAVVVPYATRSNDSLKIRQECLSIVEAMKYLMDVAADSKRPTRIVIDPSTNNYMLEIASGVNDRDYMPLEGFGGDVRCLGPSVKILDIAGFDTEGKNHCLTFEPASRWPTAILSLSSGNEVKTIRINGKQVEIEDSEITQQ